MRDIPTVNKPRIFRKRNAIALVALAPISVGAFFLATGSGSGTGHVQTGGAPVVPLVITVADPQATGGVPLTPGVSSDTNAFTITANGQEPIISTVTVVMKVDGSGNIVDQRTGNAVVGCKGTWYSPTLTTSQTLPAQPEIDGTVTTTMQDSGTDQSVCENTQPEITVSASS